MTNTMEKDVALSPEERASAQKLAEMGWPAMVGHGRGVLDWASDELADTIARAEAGYPIGDRLRALKRAIDRAKAVNEKAGAIYVKSAGVDEAKP